VTAAERSPERRGDAPGPVRIRPARLEEAAAIARVMRAAVLGQRGRYPARTVEAWSRLPALYHRWAMTAGGERYLVAVRAGRLLGYAAWRGGELTALFVRPEAAGHGLGARLLRRLEAVARAGGAHRLTMVAARAVVPFYLAKGWRLGRRTRSALPGGGALPAVRLWQDLPTGRRPR
jgi:putative acetyltransferase